MKDLESLKNLNSSESKNKLENLLGMLLRNPYCTAKLLHGIATDAFNIANINEDVEKLRKNLPDLDESSTKMSWGNFLPERIRELLLNISRYFLDNVLA